MVSKTLLMPTSSGNTATPYLIVTCIVHKFTSLRLDRSTQIVIKVRRLNRSLRS